MSAANQKEICQCQAATIFRITNPLTHFTLQFPHGFLTCLMVGRKFEVVCYCRSLLLPCSMSFSISIVSLTCCASTGQRGRQRGRGAWQRPMIWGVRPGNFTTGTYANSGQKVGVVMPGPRNGNVPNCRLQFCRLVASEKRINRKKHVRTLLDFPDYGIPTILIILKPRTYLFQSSLILVRKMA